MGRQLNLLLVEDSEIDAELVLHELRRHGYDITHDRVDTPQLLSDALVTGQWDVVLCDHGLPSFNSSDAFRAVCEASPETPFLILSGTIGEEAAVEALKAGARDVIVKTNLSRLGPVVDRELEEATIRRQQGRAEQALLVSEARKSAILDSALDCVITIDHEGHIVEFNRAAETSFGYRKEDVIGKPIVDLLVPPSLRRRHSAGFTSFLATGEGEVVNQRIETAAMRADGSEFPVELLVTQGELSGQPFFTGYLRDITERKQAEEERQSLETQLRQAQKMEAIGLLAGGIAHDFNNLLTVIIGYSEIALARLDETHPLRQEMTQIELAGRRASALTGKLLAFSRQQVLEPHALNFNTVVCDIVPMLRRLIGEDIELVTRLATELGQVNADPSQLEQVIMNLAINARDAMPTGGQLTIETAAVELDLADVNQHAAAGVEPGLYAMLAVSDTGEGIDEQTQARIFEPFFTTKDATKGTGLGLSTVYGIAKQSGGFVSLDSEPGRGAAFKVYLPIARDANEEPKAPAASEDIGAWTRYSETVLLVEDDDLVRGLVQSILENNGYNVLVANNGATALAICDQHDGEIHLGVTDIVMPGMTGIDLGEQLRIRRPEMKLLLMSGYTEHTLADLGRLGAGTGFIQKPFSATAFRQKTRELLDAR